MEYCKLTGSEKQIAWAETIRRKTIEFMIEKHGPIDDMKPTRKAGMEIMIEKITSAAWWIEHKEGYESIIRHALNDFGGYNVPV